MAKKKDNTTYYVKITVRILKKEHRRTIVKA